MGIAFTVSWYRIGFTAIARRRSVCPLLKRRVGELEKRIDDFALNFAPLKQITSRAGMIGADGYKLCTLCYVHRDRTQLAANLRKYY